MLARAFFRVVSIDIGSRYIRQDDNRSGKKIAINCRCAKLHAWASQEFTAAFFFFFLFNRKSRYVVSHCQSL